MSRAPTPAVSPSAAVAGTPASRTVFRIVLCLALSLLLHWASDLALSSLPPRPPPKPHPTRVTMTTHERPPEPLAAVVTPEPEPIPEPLPEPVVVPAPAPPPPDVPPAPRSETPKARTQRTPTLAAVTETPPPNREPPPTAATTAMPIKGLTLESTSTTGTGPALPTGNTHVPTPASSDPRPGTPQTLPPAQTPAPTYEVSKMPTMQGDCRGKYTDAARAEGIEGTVVLDLIVGADGRTSAIKVIKGLGHGLDEAAIATLSRCRFKPGTRGSEPVAVQLRAFKVRFFLDEDGR